ncbi:MAG: dephospho-CoA kinase [Flavobacteriales bacterium]|jgi:dephospho-CoA kinase|tara:strand:- start:18127 stop:18714 length:588 start_codon:yes stop_codon:yes gene_type:complete
MKNVGLSGGIGSGKTTVSKILKNNGIPVYDSDTRAKFIMNNSYEIKKRIIDNFGKESYQDNVLNKKHISKLVFNDKVALKKINMIVHPFILKDFIDWKKSVFYKYVVYESALIFESGFYKNNDYNILVISDKNERIERVVKRDNVNKKDVVIRINNQWEDEKKIPLADYIINNNSISKINQRVLNLIDTLDNLFN